MTKKISEVLELIKKEVPDFTLEDLIDDESGLSMANLRASLKDAGASKEQVKKLTGQIQEAVDVNRQWQDWHKSVAPLIEKAKTTPSGSPANIQAQTDLMAIFAEPEYARLKPTFEYLVKVVQTFAENYQQLVTNYTDFQKQVYQYADRFDVAQLGQKHKDFDEAAVRDYAKKHQVNNWDAAYDGWSAERARDPEAVKQAEEIARKKFEEEAKQRAEAGRTEMGGGGGAPPSRTGEATGGKRVGLEGLGERVTAAMREKGWQ